MLNILKYIASHPLTKRTKINSFLRFIKWQFSSRLFPFPVVYPFVNQTRLVIKKGMTGATGNIYVGLHEFNDMAFTLHLLRQEDYFADIGSNVGTYTVLASGAIGARTYAFEPIPSTFRHLKDNIAINDISEKVDAFNIGIGEKPGSLAFTSSLDTVNHMLTDKEKLDPGIQRIDVNVKRLDDLENLPVPVLIKIDVEGVEKEVLKGGEQIFKNPSLKAIIIELNGSGRKYGYDDNDIHQTLLDWGFSPFEYQPFQRKLNPVSSFGNFNTIYIKDLAFAESRIKSAPEFKVLDHSI